MFCDKCGQEIPQGSRFCPGCGAPVDAAPPETYRPPAPQNLQAAEEAPPRPKKGKRIIVIVLAVSALLAVGLFLLHHLHQK